MVRLDELLVWQGQNLKEGDLEAFGLKKVKRKGERSKEVPVRVNQQDVTGEKFIVK